MSIESIKNKQESNKICSNHLEIILHEGAKKMLAQALELEIEDYLQKHKNLRDEKGKALVVRNGSLPEREIHSGLGKIPIKQPRIKDRRVDKNFTSAILPRYLRRIPSIDNLIPTLYLHGVSDARMDKAISSILGGNATGLSATNVRRLRESWQEEYKTWQSRDLSGKNYVYFWADGIYLKTRLTNEKPCLLVIVGAREDGTKEIVGIHDGERESKLSWSEFFLNLKNQGLKNSPKLAIGDGALGFWASLREQFPACREQRCWVHKTKNILNCLPKTMHKNAKEKIWDIYAQPTKKLALKKNYDFIKLYQNKYPKATECLAKNEKELFNFYDFPAAHWRSIRTTNPIESSFSSIRHRHRQTKGCGNRTATLSMFYKLAMEVQKNWKRLYGYREIDKIIKGTKFIDGEEVQNEKQFNNKEKNKLVA